MGTTLEFEVPRLTRLDGKLDQDPSFILDMSVQGSRVLKPYVSCPMCSTVTCTKCRAVDHSGECSGLDLDPALIELLKKWRIKRCPKCRTGVRKVYGCTHVE
jgi:hypothetical protein